MADKSPAKDTHARVVLHYVTECALVIVRSASVAQCLGRWHANVFHSLTCVHRQAGSEGSGEQAHRYRQAGPDGERLQAQAGRDSACWSAVATRSCCARSCVASSFSSTLCVQACLCVLMLAGMGRSWSEGTLPKAKSWPLRARLLPKGPLSAAKAGSTWTREATQGGATRANACRQLDANACRQAAPGSLARALAAAWVDLPARYLAGSIAVEICPLRGTLLSPSSEGRHRPRALQHPSSSVSVRAHSGPSRLATHCLQPHPAGAAPGAPCSVARRGGSDAMHGGAGRLLTRPSFASSC